MPDATAWALYAAVLVAAGVASGFAGGLFGVGGGILRVPIFLAVFPHLGVAPEVAMHLAAGTSLALAVPTSLRAAWTQQRAGNLDPAFLRVWVPPVVAGVVVGLGLQRVLAGPRVELLFALVVLGIAVRMIRAREDQARARPLPGRATLGLAGAGLGALSTVLGLTGGTFMTPALSAFGLGLHRAVATSAATGVAIAAVGAIGSVVNGIGEAGRGPASLGYVELPAFLLMAPAVWLMAPLGVRVANRLPQRRLSRVFGAFLLVVGADMLHDAVSAGALVRP